MPKRFLAIDGGGIRGVYAAHVLERLQATFSLSFHEHFEIIAGTSTGSIIAAALALDIPIGTVKQLYKEKGSEIFSYDCWSAKGLLYPMYPSAPLRNALTEVFGERTMKDAKTRLIIPTTDIANGSVHVVKSAYDRDFSRDPNRPIVDVILASCSAPAYFAPAQVGEYLLADGGLWANNPSLVVLTEAMTRLKLERPEIRLLSIGTGIGKQYYKRSTVNRSWGFATDWGMKKFIAMLLNLQSETANNMTKLLLDGGRMVRVNFESDTDLPLDDISSIPDLISKADHDFTHNTKDIRELLFDE